MSHKARLYVRKLFTPDNNKTLGSDMVILSICTVSMVVFATLMISQGVKDNHADHYACAGPGFADFGCDGGLSGDVVDGVGAILFLIFLLTFIILLNRSVYRYRMNKKSDRRR